MSTEGPTRVRQITAALPVAVLVGAGVVGLGSPTAPPLVAADDAATPSADIPVIDEDFAAPASVSQPREDRANPFTRISDNTDIPPTALSAYHKAELIMGRTDRSCGLPWSVLAAIGKVESDHGRYGGSTLGDDGVSHPAIIGIALDGTRGTREIRDTDAGQLDGDERYDRAVGPMQFIPGTWTVVRVDGDGDGVRDPQDIDDAALAAGVYLCSGDDDLGTGNGLRSAVLRYNHSQAYVDTVAKLAAQYATGSYVDDGSMPTATPDDDVFADTADDDQVTPGDPGNTGTGTGPIPGSAGVMVEGEGWTVDVPPAPEPPEEDFPAISDPKPQHGGNGQDDTDDDSTDDDSSDSGETDVPTETPTPKPTGPTEPEIPVVDPTVPSTDPAVEDAYLLNAGQACTDAGLVDDPALTDDAYDLCVAEQVLTLRANDLCMLAGAVDDPARTDDEFDLCVQQALELASS